MLQASKSVSDGFRDGLGTVHTKVIRSVSMQMTELDKQATSMTGTCSEGKTEKSSGRIPLISCSF